VYILVKQCGTLDATRPTREPCEPAIWPKNRRFFRKSEIHALFSQTAPLLSTTRENLTETAFSRGKLLKTPRATKSSLGIDSKTLNMSNSTAKSNFRRPAEHGFSLLELVIVCAIISIVAAISLASFANRDQAGRFQGDVAARLRERRASAIRINALTEPTLLENYRQPPIGIDFTNLPTTAALVVEGDEHTTFTVPRISGGTAKWEFVYQGNPLQIPSGWRIATGADDLSPIPVISLGTPTTNFSFTSDGKVESSSLPAYNSNTNPDTENPFPTIYLTNGTTARAVAVHPSGLVELWNYDEATGRWTGFSGRQTPTPSCFGRGCGPAPPVTPTPTPGPVDEVDQKL
jgi:prepilin-type N-terminal cleavage/methylation domain-containing protein